VPSVPLLLTEAARPRYCECLGVLGAMCRRGSSRKSASEPGGEGGAHGAPARGRLGVADGQAAHAQAREVHAVAHAARVQVGQVVTAGHLRGPRARDLWHA